MSATQQPSADAPHGLHLRVLVLPTLASVLGWAVGSAFGGDLVATGVCAAILPLITAFITVPSPRNTRVRRVAVVLGFAGLVAACRRPHDPGGEVGCVPGQVGASAAGNPVGAAPCA